MKEEVQEMFSVCEPAAVLPTPCSLFSMIRVSFPGEVHTRECTEPHRCPGYIRWHKHTQTHTYTLGVLCMLLAVTLSWVDWLLNDWLIDYWWSIMRMIWLGTSEMYLWTRPQDITSVRGPIRKRATTWLTNGCATMTWRCHGPLAGPSVAGGNAQPTCCSTSDR